MNLKKAQQREIVRVLLHCCLNEKTYNPYYRLLAERFIEFDPKDFKYTFKYALWDYLKTLENLEVAQIVNLSKFCGDLFAREEIPLHFLKVIEFNELGTPTLLFLQLAFEHLLNSIEDIDKLQVIFAKGLKDSELKKQQFVKGLS